MIPILDLRSVSTQSRLMHAAAEGFDHAVGARIVLRTNGVDPARPQPLEPSAEAFVVGAIDPLAEAVMRLNRGGRNVWISPVVYAGGLGGEPLGVIGFGIELAGAAADSWLQRLAFPPTALLRAIRSMDHGMTWFPPITIADNEAVGAVDPQTGQPIRDSSALFSVSVSAGFDFSSVTMFFHISPFGSFTSAAIGPSA